MHIAGDDVLVIPGTEAGFSEAIKGMTGRDTHPFVKTLDDALTNLVTGGTASVRWGNRTLDFSEPRIMGILNVTPDSFSDGGLYYHRQNAVDRAIRMAEEGAYIIDIGGESTRPGAAPVSPGEELERILPVIRDVRSVSQVPISVDTYHPEVAARALEEGADIVNDITGLGTSEMRRVVRDAGCPFIIMHMLGTPQTMQNDPRYDDVVYEVMRFLAQRLAAAGDDGLDVSRAILDPGLGFGKKFRHNVTLLNRLDDFMTLGHPVMVGASRKSFIGALTGGGRDSRLEGSIAAAVLAYAKGAALLRVHDVAETRRALSVARGIVTGQMTGAG